LTEVTNAVPILPKGQRDYSSLLPS